MKPQVARREETSCLILLIGGVVYLLLCLPLMNRPASVRLLDPFWLAASYLWPVPILLSALFDELKFRSRRIHLQLYVFVITVIFAASWLGRPLAWLQLFRRTAAISLFLCAILYIVHLVGAYLSDRMVSAIMGRFRTLVDRPEPRTVWPQLSLAGWLFAYSMVCCAVGVPLVYREYAFRAEVRDAVVHAEQDWRGGQALPCCVFEIRRDGVRIVYYSDPMADYARRLFSQRFLDAYQTRVEQLVSRQPGRRGTIRPGLPNVGEMVALLADPEYLAAAKRAATTPSYVGAKTPERPPVHATRQQLLGMKEEGVLEFPIRQPFKAFGVPGKWITVLDRVGRQVATVYPDPGVSEP
jgi:hypothetical protein